MLMRSGPGCDRLVEERDLRPLRQPPRGSSGGQLSLRQQQRRSERHGDGFSPTRVVLSLRNHKNKIGSQMSDQSPHLIRTCVHQVVSGWAEPVSAPTTTCLFTWPGFTPTTTPPCIGETTAEASGRSCTASPTDTSGTPCQVRGPLRVSC